MNDRRIAFAISQDDLEHAQLRGLLIEFRFCVEEKTFIVTVIERQRLLNELELSIASESMYFIEGDCVVVDKISMEQLQAVANRLGQER